MADTYTINLGLKKPGYDSPADIGDFNANMDKIDAAYKTVDAAKLGGKAPEYYIQPRNLLDNSDFTNPVNQRGETSYNYGETKPTIDRWKGVPGVTVNDGYITVFGTNATTAYNFYQYFPLGTLKVGEMYTMAVKLADGSVHVGSVKTVSGSNKNAYNGSNFDLQIAVESNGLDSCDISVHGSSSVDVVWAALYEGEYTADTLPPYVPKGYAAELAECQRYYRRFVSTHAGYNIQFPGIVTNSLKSVVCSTSLSDMRVAPSVSFTGGIYVRGVNGYSSDANYNAPNTTVKVSSISQGGIAPISIRLIKSDDTAWADLTNNTLVVVSMSNGSVIEFSADL